MKALVCIDNNLEKDSRLKRHVTALAEQMDTVYVLARPTPTREPGIKLPNVKFIFCENTDIVYPVTPNIRDIASELGVVGEINEICSLINNDDYYQLDVIEEFRHEQEVLLAGGRWKEIVNRKSEEMPPDKDVSYIVSFLINSLTMAKMAEKIPADVILCNDVDTLLCGVIHKRKHQSRMVYDIQDLMCDISPGLFSILYSQMLMRYENIFINNADMVIGVGNYILEWAQLHYHIKVPCVPIYSCNVKEYSREVSPKYFDEEVLRIYYHGLAFPARNLENVVRALKNVDGLELVLRCGDSSYIRKVKKLVKELKIEKRVKFYDMVCTEEVLKATNRDGDIGIYATSPEGCVNWMASFTNKFMEYLGAALPIITTNACDQAMVVNKYHCGYILESDSVDSITDVFRKLVVNRKELEQMSQNSYYVANEVFNWDIYKKVFIDAILGNEPELLERQIAQLSTQSLDILEKWNKEDDDNKEKFVFESVSFQENSSKYVEGNRMHRLKQLAYRDRTRDVFLEIMIVYLCVINVFEYLFSMRSIPVLIICWTILGMSVIIIIRAFVILSALVIYLALRTWRTHFGRKRE